MSFYKMMRIMQRGFAALSVLVLLAGLCGAAVAQDLVPAVLNYQGRLTDPSDGTPLESGEYKLEFRIWSDRSSSDPSHLVWGRSFPVYVVTNGLFNAFISNNGGIVAGAPADDLRQAFQGADRFLGVTVIETPEGVLGAPVELGRHRFMSAPYSMRAHCSTMAHSAESAHYAQRAINAEKLGDLASDGYMKQTAVEDLGRKSGYKEVALWSDGPKGEASQLTEHQVEYTSGHWHYISLFNWIWIETAHTNRVYNIGETATAPAHDVKLRISDGTVNVPDGIETGVLSDNGGALEVKGNLNAMGYTSGSVRLTDPDSSFTHINSYDTTYIVKVQGASCKVSFGGHIWSIDQSFYHYNMNVSSFPVPAGEEFKVENINVHYDDNWGIWVAQMKWGVSK